MTARVSQNFNLAQTEMLNDDPLNVTWLMPSKFLFSYTKLNYTLLMKTLSDQAVEL